MVLKQSKAAVVGVGMWQKKKKAPQDFNLPGRVLCPPPAWQGAQLRLFMCCCGTEKPTRKCIQAAAGRMFCFVTPTRIRRPPPFAHRLILLLTLEESPFFFFFFLFLSGRKLLCIIDCCHGGKFGWTSGAPLGGGGVFNSREHESHLCY